jgi:hypothetical protein
MLALQPQGAPCDRKSCAFPRGEAHRPHEGLGAAAEQPAMSGSKELFARGRVLGTRLDEVLQCVAAASVAQRMPFPDVPALPTSARRDEDEVDAVASLKLRLLMPAVAVEGAPQGGGPRTNAVGGPKSTTPQPSAAPDGNGWGLVGHIPELANLVSPLQHGFARVARSVRRVLSPGAALRDPAAGPDAAGPGGAQVHEEEPSLEDGRRVVVTQEGPAPPPSLPY